MVERWSTQEVGAGADLVHLAVVSSGGAWCGGGQIGRAAGGAGKVAFLLDFFSFLLPTNTVTERAPFFVGRRATL